MELWHFEFLEIGPKTRKLAKIGKNGPLESSFYLVLPPSPCLLCTGVNSHRTAEPSALGKQAPVHGRARQGGELNSPNLVQAISHTNPLLCTLGQELNLIF